VILSIQVLRIRTKGESVGQELKVEECLNNNF